MSVLLMYMLWGVRAPAGGGGGDGGTLKESLGGRSCATEAFKKRKEKRFFRYSVLGPVYSYFEKGCRKKCPR